jgi:uncharacterized repeat protein (TIGR03803 family)
MDKSGALYGTTLLGGSYTGDGVVFKLTPPATGKTAWTETVLYAFTGGKDGDGPAAPIIMDGSGALYGTTLNGGDLRGCSSAGCGVVFKLTPPAPGKTVWTETVLYAFTGGKDGGHPSDGLVLDKSGALYGTAQRGGLMTTANGCLAYNGCGVVFKLAPPSPGKTAWTETVLHTFTGGKDGHFPGGITMDGSGTLYGTTFLGGNVSACHQTGQPQFGCGVVFKIVPPSAGTTTWTETELFTPSFGEGGVSEYLTIDSLGALYGAYGGGASKLTPPTVGKKTWTETELYNFTSGIGGEGPNSPLVVDNSGALHGTTEEGGALYGLGFGVVFTLTPPVAGSTAWTETVLHSFSGGKDGGMPESGLIMDSLGRFYGTTRYGGDAGGGNGRGTVFMMTP